MSVFLWEIGTEEIPAGKLAAAIDALKANMEKAVQEEKLAQSNTDILVEGTPRRLMVSVTHLADKQPDSVEERRGPPVSSAFDKRGQPTKAAEGFAKGCGVQVADLGRLETPKGDYLSHTIRQPGQRARDVLPRVMNTLLTTFPWAKTQRWGTGEMRFVRPINWIVALLDGELLPYATPDGLASGRWTQGHRFMARGPFEVSDLESYGKAMTQGHVVLSSEERKGRIVAGTEALASQVGGVAVMSEALLMENVGLTEWPVPLLGRFDEGYLSIPPEVLITSMQHHQKYFPIRNPAGGLLPCFVAVSNIDTKDNTVLVTGYERVLRARLEDAAFYWNSDRTSPLESRLDGLKSVVFQARLGTVYEKSIRIERLARLVCAAIPSAPLGSTLHGARLCKCDLITGMVGEFPELQGVMGGYYALASGADEAVAQTIQEHYRPQGASDALPKSAGGMVVAIADKIDTLVGCFAVGLVPSGAKDPFGLRRAALGILRIVLSGKGHHLPLKPLIKAAYDGYGSGVLDEGVHETSEALMTFFYGRLKSYLKTDGFDHDLIDAVQSMGLDDLLDVVLRIRALSEFKKSDSYVALVAANKRIANILTKSAGEKDNSPGMGTAVNASRLVDQAEKELYQRIKGCAREVTQSVDRRAYDEALVSLAQLRETIDRFFDKVMVMDDDEAIRQNRLALLALVRGTFGMVADVSRLVLPE